MDKAPVLAWLEGEEVMRLIGRCSSNARNLAMACLAPLLARQFSADFDGKGGC